MDMVDSLLLSPDIAFALSQCAPEGGQEPYVAHTCPKFVPEIRWRILLFTNLRPFDFL